MKTHNPAVESAAGNMRRPVRRPVFPIGPGHKPGRCENVLTKFVKALRFEVPTGYQDETGFHYGEEPERASICYCGDI